MTFQKGEIPTILKRAESFHLIPRVHGDGFVQLDLPFAKCRLHGWGHPEIPCRQDNFRIHDHRFWVNSTILVGRLGNTSYWLKEQADGPVQVYVVHRNNPSAGHQGPPYEYPVLRDERRFMPMVWEAQTYIEEETYQHPAGLLHTTTPMEPSLSLVTKIFSDDGYTPRVIGEYGVEFDNTFRRDCLTPPEAYRILHQIFETGNPS